jgi:hypothetical protein
MNRYITLSKNLTTYFNSMAPRLALISPCYVVVSALYAIITAER